MIRDLCTAVGAVALVVTGLILLAALVASALDRWQAYRLTVRTAAYPDPRPVLRVMDGGQATRATNRRRA